MEIIKLDDFIEQAEERFGEKSHKWKFVCPRCKTEQSAEDLVNAGVSKDEVQKCVGFSCVGRFDESKGCDWTLGGLLKIHEIEIEDNEGKLHPLFKLANS